MPRELGGKLAGEQAAVRVRDEDRPATVGAEGFDALPIALDVLCLVDEEVFEALGDGCV